MEFSAKEECKEFSKEKNLLLPFGQHDVYKKLIDGPWPLYVNILECDNVTVLNGHGERVFLLS